MSRLAIAVLLLAVGCECYLVDDLVQHKNEKSIREAGKLRSEGKDYVMRDGDVVNFLFNV